MKNKVIMSETDSLIKKDVDETFSTNSYSTSIGKVLKESNLKYLIAFLISIIIQISVTCTLRIQSQDSNDATFILIFIISAINLSTFSLNNLENDMKHISILRFLFTTVCDSYCVLSQIICYLWIKSTALVLLLPVVSYPLNTLLALVFFGKKSSKTEIIACSIIVAWIIVYIFNQTYLVSSELSSYDLIISFFTLISYSLAGLSLINIQKHTNTTTTATIRNEWLIVSQCIFLLMSLATITIFYPELQNSTILYLSNLPSNLTEILKLGCCIGAIVMSNLLPLHILPRILGSEWPSVYWRASTISLPLSYFFLCVPVFNSSGTFPLTEYSLVIIFYTAYSFCVWAFSRDDPSNWKYLFTPLSGLNQLLYLLPCGDLLPTHTSTTEKFDDVTRLNKSSEKMFINTLSAMYQEPLMKGARKYSIDPDLNNPNSNFSPNGSSKARSRNSFGGNMSSSSMGGRASMYGGRPSMYGAEDRASVIGQSRSSNAMRQSIQGGSVSPHEIPSTIVVIDSGAYQTRVGYVDQIQPTSVFPSVVACIPPKVSLL